MERNDQWVAPRGVVSNVRRIIADLARPPRPQLIQKSVKPAFRIAAPPFADCVRIDIQRRTNLFVLQTFRSKQDNPSPTGQPLRRPTATRETLKFLSFFSRQINRHRRLSHGSCPPNQAYMIQ